MDLYSGDGLRFLLHVGVKPDEHDKRECWRLDVEQGVGFCLGSCQQHHLVEDLSHSHHLRVDLQWHFRLGLDQTLDPV